MIAVTVSVHFNETKFALNWNFKSILNLKKVEVSIKVHTALNVSSSIKF